MRHPATLLDFVRATQGLHLITPPHNLAQLYQMFVDGYLFGDANEPRPAVPRYHYARVKQKLLAYLGFRMLASARPNGIEIDDALCRDLAARLEGMAGEFARTRRYMPQDWNVADALQELFDSRVVNQEAARVDEFEFASPIYRDYYAAVYLHDIGDRWQEAADAILQSNRDDWNDALILLSGLQPREATNALLNRVLDEEPSRAADLWLEKGAVGFTKVPDCVADAFNEQRNAVVIPDSLDAVVHAAVPYLADILRESPPPIALHALNALMQLGADAVDPLLDAAMASHSLIAASAVHALFHLGPSLALARGEPRVGSELLPPLLAMDGEGFSFNNLGTCNATLGPVALVSVPRTLQAEVSAHFGSVDFDVFDVPCSFELWHPPAAWFAIDYFRRVGRVDWIGLAAACDIVVRCAGLIVGKAMRRGAAMQPVVEELSQCAIAYGHLGRCITSDLAIPCSTTGTCTAPHELVDAADQIYKELRLFFNRANRSRMLGDTGNERVDRNVAVNQSVAQIAASVQAIALQELLVDVSDVADLPSVVQIDYAQTAGTISRGGELRGIHVARIAPVPFRAAEVYSLGGRLDVDTCTDAVVEGIRIDSLDNWHGLRLHLELNVARLERSRIVGIRVNAPVEPTATDVGTPRPEISAKQLQPLMKAVLDVLKKAPESARAQLQPKMDHLQAELLKGHACDDGTLGRLLDDVLTQLPTLAGPLAKLFETPLVHSAAGPVTQFVLDKLRKD